jgi:hypothetical protein
MVDNYGTVQYTLEKDLKGQTHESLTSGLKFLSSNLFMFEIDPAVSMTHVSQVFFSQTVPIYILGPQRPMAVYSSPIIGNDLIMSYESL